MNSLGIASHCDLLKGIPNKETMSIQIGLNENPMYFDEEGDRNFDEPLYLIAIKAKNVVDKEPPILIYDYFDSPTDEEAKRFVSRLSRTIETYGFKNIKVA